MNCESLPNQDNMNLNNKKSSNNKYLLKKRNIKTSNTSNILKIPEIIIIKMIKKHTIEEENKIIIRKAIKIFQQAKNIILRPNKHLLSVIYRN